jgi:glycosyltransferase involved in cell wall biosynthesis
MDVSVVIPTFNREKLLLKTLDKIANQDAGSFSYEVVFVINGSTDGSEAILKDAAARWPGRIRYFYNQPSGSPAKPRNTGIRAAKGNVIILIDDDVIPDPRLVFHHAEFHRLHPEQNFAAVGELRVPEEVLDDPASMFHQLTNYDSLRGKDRLGFLDFWTCNVSLKRNFMLEYGMFDENAPWFEDGLCGHRLASSGMELRFLPEAKGLHLHELKIGDVAARGAFIGRTLYWFEQQVPHREVRLRYGILSPDLGPKAYLIRVVNRILLFSLSNPLFMAAFKAAAKASAKRNRITDLYYYLLFRRSNLSGYRQAKRDARRQAQAIHPV